MTNTTQPLGLKKGKATWKPASVLNITGKEPGFNYRILEKSPRNLAKKQQEGWELLSGINNSNGTDNAGGNIETGKPLTSIIEGHDYVVARMPEDLAQSRQEYINNETERRSLALLQQTKADLGNTGAPIHGSITMEKRGVRTVIKD